MSKSNVGKRIYKYLRSHPKASREIVYLSRHVVIDDPAERIIEAQKIAVNYVMNRYGGDVSRFIRDYEADTQTGRTEFINWMHREEVRKMGIPLDSHY